MRVKNVLLALLSGILLVLAFPNFNLSWVAWVALVPLLFALAGQSAKNSFLLGFISGLVAWVALVPLLFALAGQTPKNSFLLGFLTGLVSWTGILYWIAPTIAISGNSPWALGIFSLLLLAIYLSLYLALFCLLFRFFTDYRLPITYYPLFLPSLWVLLEFLRGQFSLGFPWTLLGYSQWKYLSVIQISEFTGAYGVSFLVLMVNVTIVAGVRCKMSDVRQRIKILAIPAIILLSCFAYGWGVLNHQSPNHPITQSPKIAVLQGNIPQSLKWDPDYAEDIISRYTKLVNTVSRDSPDLVVWPETALPGALREDLWLRNWVKHLVKKSGSFHLIGGFDVKGEKYYNSAFLIRSDGGLLEQYDKIHLVPFGEYVPFKFLRKWIQVLNETGDITAEKDYKIFSAPGGKFNVGICFETIFPNLIRKFVQQGSGLIINITNDAWFGRTSAPQQHFIANIFRAVENRRWVVRAANTGISGFIDPYGRIINRTDIFKTGFLIEGVDFLDRKTFYTKYGNIFVYICGIIVILGFLRPLKKLLYHRGHQVH